MSNQPALAPQCGPCNGDGDNSTTTHEATTVSPTSGRQHCKRNELSGCGDDPTAANTTPPVTSTPSLVAAAASGCERGSAAGTGGAYGMLRGGRRDCGAATRK